MTVYIGQNGVMQVGGTAVAQVRGFTFETTVEAIDTSVMGQAARTYRAGMMGATGGADLLFSDTHEAEVLAFLQDDTVTLSLYPTGTGAGNPVITANIIITGYSLEATMDDVVTATISYTCTGAPVFTGVDN